MIKKFVRSEWDVTCPDPTYKQKNYDLIFPLHLVCRSRKEHGKGDVTDPIATVAFCDLLESFEERIVESAILIRALLDRKEVFEDRLNHFDEMTYNMQNSIDRLNGIT